MTKFDILAARGVPVRHKNPFCPLAKVALGFAIPVVGWAYSLATMLQIANSFSNNSIESFHSLNSFRSSVLRGGVISLPILLALALAIGSFWIPTVGFFVSSLIMITLLFMVMLFWIPYFATQSDLSLRFNLHDAIDYIGRNALRFLILDGIVLSVFVSFCAAIVCIFQASNMLGAYGMFFSKAALGVRICAGAIICFALAASGEIFAALAGTIYRISNNSK